MQVQHQSKKIAIFVDDHEKKNVSNTCPINSKFFFKARNLLHYPSGNYFNDAL